MNNDWREYPDPNYVLMHHGIKGQKWGVRNYQNSDGTLTAAGKARYGNASGKVEKKLAKATSWENRAINAKTGVGRSISTAMAGYRRTQADTAADKATKNYGVMQINRNTARSLGANAEAHANVAAGLKKKAESKSGVERERILNNAVKHLATAENMETAGKAYSKIANAPAGKKGAAFIKENFKMAIGNQYTQAGRATNWKDRLAESVGNMALDKAFSIATNSNKGPDNERRDVNIATKVNAVGVARDVAYRQKNSASNRWNKIMNDGKR